MRRPCNYRLIQDLIFLKPKLLNHKAIPDLQVPNHKTYVERQKGPQTRLNLSTTLLLFFSITKRKKRNLLLSQVYLQTQEREEARGDNFLQNPPRRNPLETQYLLQSGNFAHSPATYSHSDLPAFPSRPPAVATFVGIVRCALVAFPAASSYQKHFVFFSHKRTQDLKRKRK